MYEAKLVFPKELLGGGGVPNQEKLNGGFGYFLE